MRAAHAPCSAATSDFLFPFLIFAKPAKKRYYDARHDDHDVFKPQNTDDARRCAMTPIFAAAGARAARAATSRRRADRYFAKKSDDDVFERRRTRAVSAAPAAFLFTIQRQR